MATKATLMVNPTTGAISAPVLAADFRNNNGLQIGTNIQAWSTDLDNFVTNGSWSGTTLVLAAGLNVGTALNVGTVLTVNEIQMGASGILALGAGSTITINSVEVPTISSTNTLTNKTIDLGSNTLTATSLQLKTAISDETGSGALVFANTPTLVSPILGTPTSGNLSNCTALPLTTGITGTLGFTNGGTNATTQGGGRVNFGGARYGFANGGAVLASTPEYIGQWAISDDGYVALSRGTSAGNLNPFAVIGNGQIYIQQNTQFSAGTSSGTIYVDRQLNAGYGGENYEHWLKNNGTDNVANIQNTHADWYSAFGFYTSDNLKVAAMGLANPNSAATLRDKVYIHGNTDGAGRFATIPPIVQIGQDFDYSGGGFVSHGFIQVKGGDGGKFGTGIYGLHATNAVGTIGLWVNEDARVGIGTDTLTSGAELTVNGEIAVGNGAVGTPSFTFSNDTDCGMYRIGSNDIGFSVNGVKIMEWNASTPPAVTVTGELISAGTNAALVVRSQAGGNGGQLYCPDDDRVQLNSAVNGEIWRYTNTTAVTTFKHNVRFNTTGSDITRIKHGVATLVGGAVTVSETTVTANSRIIVTSQSDGGTPGWLRISARVASTSFTITSSSGTDTSTVGWVLVEP